MKKYIWMAGLHEIIHLIEPDPVYDLIQEEWKAKLLCIDRAVVNSFMGKTRTVSTMNYHLCPKCLEHMDGITLSNHAKRIWILFRLGITKEIKLLW